MDATLILIDSDAELARALALVERLIVSNDPKDDIKLAAQARLIAAYEEQKWPRSEPTVQDLLAYLIDQHTI
jgi:antitoxin component HigA of HigAB toxin-antitoxin module